MKRKTKGKEPSLWERMDGWDRFSIIALMVMILTGMFITINAYYDLTNIEKIKMRATMGIFISTIGITFLVFLMRHLHELYKK